MLALLTGCATGPPVLAPILGPDPSHTRGVNLTDVPFYPQQRYHCGPAALATVLNASGVDTSAEDLVPLVYLPERQGSLQVELLAATRSSGRVAYELYGGLRELIEELSAGRPVLVMQNLGLRSWPAWHYAVAVGFDPASDEVLLRSGTTRELRLSARAFMKTWERADKWAMVALRPAQAPADPHPRAWLEAIAAMESRHPPGLMKVAYTAYLDIFPNEPLAWFGLANAMVARNEYSAAEQIYHRLLLEDPGAAAVRNNLAHTLALRGCPDQALAQIETGLAALPAGSAYRDMLDVTRSEIMRNPQRAAGGCTQ